MSNGSMKGEPTLDDAEVTRRKTRGHPLSIPFTPRTHLIGCRLQRPPNSWAPLPCQKR